MFVCFLLVTEYFYYFDELWVLPPHKVFFHHGNYDLLLPSLHSDLVTLALWVILLSVMISMDAASNQIQSNKTLFIPV